MTTQIDPLLDIQTKVLRATFVNNMAVLKKFMPEVFNFYQDYTPTRVKLIFDENGFLNLVSNGNLIYKDDPKKSSEQQVTEFMKKPHNIIYHVKRDGAGDFEHEKVLIDIIERREKDIGLSTQAVFPQDEQIDFIAFMGTGLGYHLQKLFEQKDIRFAFVYEPDPDCFFCTLHSVDIGDMIKACFAKGGQLTLQIGGNSNGFVNEIAKIFRRQGYFNVAKMFLYRHYLSDETSDAFQKVHDLAYRYVNGWGFFEDEIISLTHSLSNISVHKFPSILKTAREHKRELPLFIIGNGPSLDDSLEYIKENQANVIIFSCGTALKPLLDYGIIPDFHAETERTAELLNWVDQIGHKEKLKEINLICLNTVYPEILKLFKNAHLILKPQDAGSAFMKEYISEKYDELYFSNPTVSNTATAAAVAMGFNNMFLFGVDYGYKSELHHHSKGSLYYDEKSEQHTAEMKGDFKVAGNFVDEVYTTQFYDSSRMMLEMLLENNPHVHCVNTSDGARIQLTTALHKNELTDFLPIDNKEQYLQLVLDESFDNSNYISRNLTHEFEALLPKFKAYAKQLCDFTKEVKTRKELSEAFSQQYKFVENTYNNRSKKIFHSLMSGTINYLQSNIMSNTYLYADLKQQAEFIQFCLETMNEHIKWLLIELENNYDKPSKI